MKLSEKLVYTDYEEARDKAQIKYQIYDEIEGLENENKLLAEENDQLKQNLKSMQELKDKLTERERDIDTLNTQILALQSSEYRVALMKERDELKAEINIMNSLYEREKETNKELIDKLQNCEYKLKMLKGCNHKVKCLSCEKLVCKVNDTLGYSCCNNKNDFADYRQVIKEME